MQLSQRQQISIRLHIGKHDSWSLSIPYFALQLPSGIFLYLSLALPFAFGRFSSSSLSIDVELLS